MRPQDYPVDAGEDYSEIAVASFERIGARAGGRGDADHETPDVLGADPGPDQAGFATVPQQDVRVAHEVGAEAERVRADRPRGAEHLPDGDILRREAHRRAQQPLEADTRNR